MEGHADQNTCVLNYETVVKGGEMVGREEQCVVHGLGCFTEA